MNRYYWQGTKEFPEDAGELVFTQVKFDSETESLLVTDTLPDAEEYIIDGIDEMWLVTESFRSNTIPVKLTDLGELDTATNSYKVVGDKVLAKVRRFAKNKTDLAAMKKLTNRTTY